MINKLHLIVSVCAVSVLISHPAFADIKVRAGTSRINFSTEMTFQNRNLSATNDFQEPNIGLTYISESGLYVDLAVSKGTSPSQYSTAAGSYLTRNDESLVLGQADVGESGMTRSMYVGYKSGHTNQDGPRVGGQPTEYFINTGGVVLGGGLGLPMNFGGAVGISAGVGAMQMQWVEQYNGSMSSDRSNVSFGYSYGVSYTYPFSQTVGIVLDYKGQVYNYKFSGSSSGPTIPLTIVEKMTTTAVSLYAQF